MRFIVFILSFFTLFAFPIDAKAKLNLATYDVTLDNVQLKKMNTRIMDSCIAASLQLEKKPVATFITKPIIRENKTSDFYFLLLLTFLWGWFKTANPKFFNDVWRAFINPTLGSRQLKEIIQSATLPNLIMNLLASLVLGIYFYFIISVNVDWRFSSIPKGLAVGLIAIGTLIMYAGKYVFVQFAGWAFNISSSAEQYNFNVFLVNKILGLALLPFVICFAFLDARWYSLLIISSLILLGILLLARYIRSWNIFSIFFQNSGFHFFMYLCAFELLPMAVILKMVSLII